ncbi:hypothetical protein RSOLAG22IIIB_05769 [Rhizoctonia solani]|uniref:RING-type domain-containing protein n=1 Tax=Rhizoctonia solani TaxID=456999 RepID=A0A0K6G9A3_9AGAM|nr:unnamed protein product [Rhizoctonia solani]CUA75203.1 hypothetical protein RSOLAG22IIIB_05769 [Rhizoctonia solani]
MPSSPHLICSICETNVDTGDEDDKNNEESATWLIFCSHVVCNSCYTSIVHASKSYYLCKHCGRKYVPERLNPQRIRIVGTIPPIQGESRGLQEVAERLLKERNKILSEGSKLLERFKTLQDEVEKEDSNLESLLDETGADFGGSSDALGESGGASALMEGVVRNDDEWTY